MDKLENEHKAINDVWDCATYVDEYGLVNYDNTILHNELEILKDRLAIIFNEKE
jgi:hypothetical protein